MRNTAVRSAAPQASVGEQVHQKEEDRRLNSELFSFLGPLHPLAIILAGTVQERSPMEICLSSE